jgi:hypothetical protein
LVDVFGEGAGGSRHLHIMYALIHYMSFA